MEKFNSENDEESHSSNSDRHWKRSKKSKPLSVCDDDEFFKGIASSSKCLPLPSTLLVREFLFFFFFYIFFNDYSFMIFLFFFSSHLWMISPKELTSKVVSYL